MKVKYFKLSPQLDVKVIVRNDSMGLEVDLDLHIYDLRLKAVIHCEILADV